MRKYPCFIRKHSWQVYNCALPQQLKVNPRASVADLNNYRIRDLNLAVIQEHCCVDPLNPSAPSAPLREHKNENALRLLLRLRRRFAPRNDGLGLLSTSGNIGKVF